MSRLDGESVGVSCMVGGRAAVREYSELSPHLRDSRDCDGELLYRAANICIHYLSMELLTRAVARESEMPIHLASKKIPHLDTETGQLVTPEQPNGFKLEKFVFDCFQLGKEFFKVQMFLSLLGNYSI